MTELRSTEELGNLTKEELIMNVIQLENEIQKLEAQLNSKKTGRKQLLFEIMSDYEHYELKQLSKLMSEKCGKPINSKNISSLLTYLRTDGHPICTDHLGKKFLLSE